MQRYSIIENKNPREIVLLRGKGCCWKKCTFCDYHLDSSTSDEENYHLNKDVLSKVTGIYQHLEVINSGSFPELDEKTIDLLIKICQEKSIKILHFECHWIYRNKISTLRERFATIGTELKIKTGVESFDYEFREKVLNKGISEENPAIISEHFNECCLLFGLNGQTYASMKKDIETGLKYFERVCVNIYVENTTSVKPIQDVIDIFINEIMPDYIHNDRVDILLNNTDFGVGGN